MTGSLLIAILIIALVVFVCFWIVDAIGIPAPINMIVKAIIGVVGIIALLSKSGLM